MKNLDNRETVFFCLPKTNRNGLYVDQKMLQVNNETS